jgi:hypothetical protein
VINPNRAGTQRTQFIRVAALATRLLLSKSELDDEARDLAAFISFTLAAIFSTVEPTVQAWEKRDYWVKADQFRLEWQWTDNLGREIAEALRMDDWKAVRNTAERVQKKLGNVKISVRHRMGTPWVGAWDTLQKKQPD